MISAHLLTVKLPSNFHHKWWDLEKETVCVNHDKGPANLISTVVEFRFFKPLREAICSRNSGNQEIRGLNYSETYPRVMSCCWVQVMGGLRNQGFENWESTEEWKQKLVGNHFDNFGIVSIIASYSFWDILIFELFHLSVCKAVFTISRFDSLKSNFFYLQSKFSQHPSLIRIWLLSVNTYFIRKQTNKLGITFALVWQ